MHKIPTLTGFLLIQSQGFPVALFFFPQCHDIRSVLLEAHSRARELWTVDIASSTVEAPAHNITVTCTAKFIQVDHIQVQRVVLSSKG